ncbi:uncharacterized protein LOC134190512 [Corticium candelabrum]|uniref:uncharacterized protein LOC134190512 n=1 Tax=Corticium candelabrum TaxID=121492 RepID=UPI002E2631A3|nr:uncharacterized protein LOC134190512 [Corticium candelabrum]
MSGSLDLTSEHQNMSEKVAEERQSWLDRISRLKTEISVIEGELEEKWAVPLDTSDQSIRAIIQQLESQDVTATGIVPVDDSSDDEQTVQQLKTRAALMSAMTGITFTSVSCRTLEEDGTSAQRQYEVGGSCHGRQFNLQFLVREMEVVRDTATCNLLPQLSMDDVSKTFVQGQIRKLEISVDESLEHHLEEFISVVEKDNAPQRFFQVFEAYTASCDTRDKLFHHLQAKYSGIIRIASNDDDDHPILVIDIPSSSSLSFKLHWIPEILTSTDEVHPRVHFQCTTPDDSTFSREERRLLTNIPEQFHLLTKEVGAESAVKTVIGKLL